MGTHVVLRRFGLVLSAVLVLHCASGAPDPATLASNSDQVIWEAAQKAQQRKQWDSARQLCKRIVDGFPQSELGPGARLALADSYFQEGGTGNWILAVSAYRDFLTLYPSHPKSDYAQFQVGEGFFQQRNGADRDQTPTTHALEEYQRLLELYPASPQVEAARARIVACRQSLAKSEYLAGIFYERRGTCRAAAFRYEGLIADYPDYVGIDEVLYRLSTCLSRTGRALEAAPHLSRLIEEFPTSGYVDQARTLLQTIPNLPPATPIATPSPAPKVPSGP